MRLPDKRCIVLDMDGTIYMGDNPIEGAVAFVQRHWEDVDFFFLSNNTSKAPETYIKKLNGMGIPARSFPEGSSSFAHVLVRYPASWPAVKAFGRMSRICQG